MRTKKLIKAELQVAKIKEDKDLIKILKKELVKWERTETTNYRFILELDDDLRDYLTWISAERQLKKADIIRGYLSSKMRNDVNYKEFLKEDND